MYRPTRRTVLRQLAASSTLLTLPCPALAGIGKPSAQLRLGVIADLHGGLAADAEHRLGAFLKAMSGTDCDALVQLGDFAFPNQAHQTFADQFNAAHDTTLHVIGNHDLDHRLTRKDCQQAWGMESPFYGQDLGEIRVLVLDGNEKGSPTHKGGYPSYIGPKQLEWLTRELNNAARPVLILSHQPLAGRIAVDNATEVQELLSRHRDKIILCLNGHSHVDSLIQENGVSYLHINSASYYWVGGETRMAYYTDPLYTTVTVDTETNTVTVEGKSSTWKDKSPKQLGYFDRDRSPPEEIVTPQIRQRSIREKHRQ